jgi:tetratricopeptide (TPR) repeat protein
MLQRIGASLAELDRQHPGSDWLCKARLETYCCLAVCHSKAGREALAEETCRSHVQPLAAKLIDQQTDLENALVSVQVLDRIASALWEAKLNAAGLPIARQAAALTSSCAGFPMRDLGFTVTVATRALDLAATLQHLGDLSAALQQSNLALHLFERASAAEPSSAQWHRPVMIVWQRIGKLRWDLGQAEESLAAFRESARIQRQLFESDTSSTDHRYELDRCYGRLAHWSTLRGDWAGTAAALLEREKLWPDDSDRLMGVSHDFKELADDMARRQKCLSAEEQTARQHYLAESERTRQAALAQLPQEGIKR